ncbi:hypothetical protein REPUB_Repub05bG0098300 [Reevesia pubescens]
MVKFATISMLLQLRNVLISLGFSKSSLQECKRMIGGVDKDGDGFVDFKVFRSVMTAESMVKCLLRYCFKGYDSRSFINWSSRKLQWSLASAEFQVPSPLVPTQENYFVRYCKQHTNGNRVVVDVSLIIYALVQCQSVEEGH